MSPATPTPLVDLDSAAHGGAQHRARMLEQVTTLFLSVADRLTEQQVGMFDEILLLLMRDLDPPALSRLGKHLAAVATAPPDVIRRLAAHEDEAVATPVLAHARRLSDTDLAAIAARCGQRHLLAISTRNAIDAAVTDILARRGDVSVARALAGNAGARLSEDGFRALLDHAARDGDVAERLGARTDLTDAMTQQLIARTSGAVRARLVRAAQSSLLSKAEATLKQDDAASTATTARKKLDYTGVEDRLRELNRTGKLTDSTISRFALERDHAQIIAALSQRSTVPVAALEPMILNQSDYSGIIVACRACRLDWSTAVAIIRSRPDCAMPSPRELNEGRAAFENMSDALALHTLHYWAANGPDSIGKAPRPPARAAAKDAAARKGAG